MGYRRFIMPILLLQDFSTLCVLDLFWPLICMYLSIYLFIYIYIDIIYIIYDIYIYNAIYKYIYIYIYINTYIYIYIPQLSFQLFDFQAITLFNIKDYLFQVTLTFCTNLALKFQLMLVFQYPSLLTYSK